MVSKDYQPAMTPEAITNSVTGESEIRCTAEALIALGISDRDTQRMLEDAVTGQAICPRIIWFRDTPEVRRALRMSISGPSASEIQV